MEQNQRVASHATKPVGCSFFKSDVCDDNKPECDGAATWQGPGGGSASFYTTWSYYAVLLCTFIILPVVWFVATKTRAKHSRTFSYITMPILIGIAANSIGVGIVSQLLITRNWKPLSKSGNPVLIKEQWVKWFTSLNTTVHLTPVLLSLLILLCVTPMPWSGTKPIMILISILVPVLMFCVWAAVPVPVSVGSTRKTSFFNKAAHVYNAPSFAIESALPIAIILVSVLYVVVIKK